MTDSERPVSDRRKKLWRVVGIVLIVAGLTTIALALHQSFGNLVLALANVHLGWVAVGFLLTVAASLISFEGFRQVFVAAGGGSMGAARLATLHFTGQLMRHLPGRYFGVLYQVADTRGQVAAGVWIAANAVHTLAIAVSGVVIGVIVVLTPSPMAAIVGIGLSTAAAVILFRLGAPPRNFATYLIGSRWRVVRSIGDPLASLLANNRPAVARCTGWVAASWVAYLGAWGCYGSAFPELGAYDGARLGAHYALAWFVGFVTVFAPSGWGVREVVFVAVAKGFSTSAIAYGLVLGRLTLLINDLFLGAAAAIWAAAQRRIELRVS